MSQCLFFMILDSTLESNVFSFGYRRKNKICDPRNLSKGVSFFILFCSLLHHPLLKLGTKLLLHTPGCVCTP